MVIAVDCHGGDYAPQEVVRGAIAAAEEYKVDIALVGMKAILHMLVKQYTKKKSSITILEASQTIDFNEDPFQAVQSKPDSSIAVGTKLVRDGIASGFVSAGNSGAVVVASFLNLGKIEGVKRAAICAVINMNKTNPVLIIDVGANADCQPSFLVEFAQLATVFAKEVLGIASPRVGLLNNGGEESKGNLLTRESYQLLKKTSLNFIGNIEGMKLLKGSVDVVVTDGFTGNIVIKTLEGVGDTFHDLLGEGQAIEVNRSLTGRGLVHYMDLISAAREVDYQAVGGASLLGVDGNVVLAHGHSNAEAIKSAIYLAHRAAQSKIVEAIKNGYGVSSNAICDYA